MPRAALGRKQKLFLAGLLALEQEEPNTASFYVSAVVAKAGELGLGGGLAEPPPPTYDHTIYRSEAARVLSLPEGRGLVVRGTWPGIGAHVGLTDTGRAIAHATITGAARAK